MKPTKAALDFAKTMADQHAALRAEIRRLTNDLPELEGGAPGRGLQVLADLRGFQAHLLRHFQLEEQGGFLESPGGRDPGTEREVSDLVGEHRRFERETQALLESLGAHVEDGGALPQTWGTELRAMLGRLAIHESKEDALYQRVYLRDVGRAD